MVGGGGYWCIFTYPTGKGVRVYADAVINHMTGGGNDVQEHRRSDGSNCVRWGAKNSTAHSPYYTHSWTFGTNPSTGFIFLFFFTHHTLFISLWFP